MAKDTANENSGKAETETATETTSSQPAGFSTDTDKVTANKQKGDAGGAKKHVQN